MKKKELKNNLQKTKAPSSAESHKGYSDKELAEFREIILKKLAKAEKDLKEMDKSLTSTNENIAQGEVKGLDDSLVVEEQENINFLIIRQKKFIQHLKKALLRIKTKTYGICIKTGQLIPKARLFLVPHTQHSVEAKQNRRLEEEEAMLLDIY
ncbi:MAG: TraR/DksA C4-type zinc finger protein [Bacteroidota bacterium]